MSTPESFFRLGLFSVFLDFHGLCDGVESKMGSSWVVDCTGSRQGFEILSLDIQVGLHIENS